MPMIVLFPKTSNYDYPLDVEQCARWLLSNEPGKRGQSHPGVIRRVAELDSAAIFIGRRRYTADEILEAIDEDGELVGEDPRPTGD